MPKTLAAIGRIGDEPILGYRLVELICQDTFGEYWKCEISGGFQKAIKIIYPFGDGSEASGKLNACLDNTKNLRHPFLLSVERVERIGNSLVVIMELADDNLERVAKRYQADGFSGMPRDEALGYLRDAAEALDWLNFTHDLQHLDITPACLFLVSRRVKIGELVMIHRLTDSLQGKYYQERLNTSYCSPEVICGHVSRFSDQYSLAVVYQQMVTGTLPFVGESVQEFRKQQRRESPNLSALSNSERLVVERALSKIPQDRFSSCSEFIRILAEQGRLKESGRSFTSDNNETQSLFETQRMVVTTQSDHKKPTESTRSTEAVFSPRSDSTMPATWLDEILQCVPLGKRSSFTWNLRRKPTQAPTTIDVSLPGYQFISCVNQTVMGDQWIALDATGAMKRAMVLQDYIGYDNRLIAYLRALQDPVLPQTEIHWSPAERLVIVTEPYEGSLRDRYDRCRLTGQPGIPRNELLTLLRSAAEALDKLFNHYRLRHLGINPRNLLIDGDRLRIADFGLIPLVWLPSGGHESLLYGRYSAPELFSGKCWYHVDQYSLAIIYTEMLTGRNPQSRRSASARTPRVSTSETIWTKSVREVDWDLTLLPIGDRDVVARALSTDPTDRFPSCAAFVYALEQSGKAQTTKKNDNYHHLMPIISIEELVGHRVESETTPPPIGQWVNWIVRRKSPKKESIMGNMRYSILEDGSWASCCPVQSFPGAMALKIEGFCSWWSARVIRREEDCYELELDIPRSRSLWNVFRISKCLKLTIKTEHSTVMRTRSAEVSIHLDYPGADKLLREQTLTELGPKVLESLGEYLQAMPDQRSRERIRLSLPVRIYPVFPHLELGPVMDGTIRNLSLTGVGLRVRSRPPVNWLYLHLYECAKAQNYAALVRMVRCRNSNGEYEIGATFEGLS